MRAWKKSPMQQCADILAHWNIRLILHTTKLSRKTSLDGQRERISLFYFDLIWLIHHSRALTHLTAARRWPVVTHIVISAVNNYPTNCLLLYLFLSCIVSNCDTSTWYFHLGKIVGCIPRYFHLLFLPKKLGISLLFWSSRCSSVSSDAHLF